MYTIWSKKTAFRLIQAQWDSWGRRISDSEWFYGVPKGNCPVFSMWKVGQENQRTSCWRRWPSHYIKTKLIREYETVAGETTLGMEAYGEVLKKKKKICSIRKGAQTIFHKFESHLGHIIFVEIDYEIISMVLPSLPLFPEGHLPVTCKSMCTRTG